MMKLNNLIFLFCLLLIYLNHFDVNCISIENLQQQNDDQMSIDKSADSWYDAQSMMSNELSESVEQHDLADRELTKTRISKKFKPIVHNGYSLDINIDTFKSTRYCYYNEICRNKYRNVFECVCPKGTLCVGQGSLFEAKCSKNLMPYIWLQSYEENAPSNFKN